MDVTPLVRMLTLFLTQHFADLVPRKSDASICFSGGSAGDSTRVAAPQVPLAHVTRTTPYLVVIVVVSLASAHCAYQRTPLTATAFGGLSVACCESHPGRFDSVEFVNTHLLILRGTPHPRHHRLLRRPLPLICIARVPDCIGTLPHECSACDGLAWLQSV